MASVERVDELTNPVREQTATPLRTVGGRLLLVAYALTIFLSAFLLFQVQPLIGKLILPWFGGMTGVWTTCMLFFQVLLFAGYAYAHLVNSRLAPRTQATVHFVLLALAACALPIIPDASWKPKGDEDPLLRIVCLLAATVGVPFFVLSSTGPLLQGWFSRTHSGRSPYRLYALSNVASLLALVSFPFLFEPILATSQQGRFWSWGFGLFALLCAGCALGLARQVVVEPPLTARVADADRSASPPSGMRCLWFALAMVPSVLLLATTNQVCQDSASVPFLWILPLTLYLLSFILCFDGERWYSRRFLMPAALIGMALAYQVMRAGPFVPLLRQLVTYFFMLFACAMVCHGELVRLKPAARHLTVFYLLISAGGAAGGIFVGVVAPLLFKGYFELHVGLFACAALLVIVLFTDRSERLFAGRMQWMWGAMLAFLGLFAGALILHATDESSGMIDIERNFYGVLRVTASSQLVDKTQLPDDAPPDNPPPGDTPEATSLPTRILMNGRILHGVEFEDPELMLEPTTYYCVDSGIGRILMQPADLKPRRVGLVGLGIGTLAAYARPGDHFQFYEIDSAVMKIARTYFHYLADCRGEQSVLLGDARLTLERQPPQNFDVLVLDAFSGDAIPIHLLTKEAFRIYLKHVTADGVIAVHISSRYFDLQPVVEAAADDFGLARAFVEEKSQAPGGCWSVWMLLSHDRRSLEVNEIPLVARPPTQSRIHWSDDHASLFEVLRREPWINVTNSMPAQE